MDQRPIGDNTREDRLLLYYQRQTQALMRKDAANSAIRGAVAITQDPRLPRLAVEFQSDERSVTGRWSLPRGLGPAFENYVSRLCEMESVRFSHSAIGGLTEQHRGAFEAVIEAAYELKKLGWPVNWEQNLQAILEHTEFGIRDGQLVDRFQGVPDRVTLGDELLLMGTVTFYFQNRSSEGVARPFRSMVLSEANAHSYRDTPLRLVGEDQSVPSRFRYASDWMTDKSGKSFRIAI